MVCCAAPNHNSSSGFFLLLLARSSLPFVLHSLPQNAPSEYSVGDAHLFNLGGKKSFLPVEMSRRHFLLINGRLCICNVCGIAYDDPCPAGDLSCPVEELSNGGWRVWCVCYAWCMLAREGVCV